MLWKPCIQKDDLMSLIPDKSCDLLVFASPLFLDNFSKNKSFIERFYCIAEEDSNPSLEDMKNIL